MDISINEIRLIEEPFQSMGFILTVKLQEFEQIDNLMIPQ